MDWTEKDQEAVIIAVIRKTGRYKERKGNITRKNSIKIARFKNGEKKESMNENQRKR